MVVTFNCLCKLDGFPKTPENVCAMLFAVGLVTAWEAACVFECVHLYNTNIVFYIAMPLWHYNHYCHFY